MIVNKRKILITLLLCFFLLISSALSCFGIVFAQTSDDIGVLEDLRKDVNFNILNYPEESTNYSMDVIHLAEGESGSVYLYVYQPSGSKKMLQAKGISLCTKDYEKYSITASDANDNVPFFIYYALEFVDCEETLFKYKVKDYNYKKDLNFCLGGEFDSSIPRKYDISTIYRPFIKNVDVALDSSAIHTEKGLEVGKVFTIKTLADGSNNISSEMAEVICITDKFVGFVRLDGGWLLSDFDRDVFFVSFSTDKKIDQLLQADVYYYQTTYKQNDTITSKKQVISEGSNTAKLNISQDCTWEGSGWSSHEFKYNRIYSKLAFDSFLSSNKDLVKTNDLPESMKNHSWLFMFAEFDYEAPSFMEGIGYTKWTSLKDVAVLRLEFRTNGVVYNLGVVDDLSTPDEKSDLELEKKPDEDDLKKLLKLILVLILVVAVLVVLAPVLPYIINFVITLIMLPFKLLGIIIKNIKKGGGSRGKKT